MFVLLVVRPKIVTERCNTPALIYCNYSAVVLGTT